MKNWGKKNVVGNLVGKPLFKRISNGTQAIESLELSHFLELTLQSGACPYQGCALPTELQQHKAFLSTTH